MPSLQKILNAAKKKRHEITLENDISKAYSFAENIHKNQKRKSGEPYFNHCFETAITLAEWGLDSKVISAGLLHDSVEDGACTIEEIKKQFSEEIAFLIDGVTKLGHFKYREKPDKKEEERVRTENFKKLILALSEDIRVIFIKLADRLHNIRTLRALPAEKQKRIALETYEVYAPLAYRLGMTNLAGELEDLAFPYIYQSEYKWLLENVPEKFEKREEYLKKVKPLIENALREISIKTISISFRAKRYSSLYKKLKRYEMNFEQIHDLVAIRIIVETIEDCYKTLGVIHHLWPPLPGRIKDYIALPKPNGYQSLHTTVFCVDNKITEIQIRTEQMHEEAENGIAAHWAYEEIKDTKPYQKRQAAFADSKELIWVKQLREWQENFSKSDDKFMDSLKVDFFRDRIFSVTPKGDVIDLPVGATPVDFAYRIHSDLGNETVGAKVNGRIVPLNQPLQSGDIIEILRQKGKKPSGDWLKFVKTSMAKDHITSELRKKSVFSKIIWKK